MHRWDMMEDVERIGAGLGMTLAAGQDALRRVGALAAGLGGDGAPVLLVSDPFLAQTGLDAPAVRSLTDAGSRVVRFSAFHSDPSAEEVDRAAAEARRAGARLVVGIGGGSALDVAKLAAAVAGADRPAEAYALMAEPFPETVLPVIAVPSTAGTGSEATRTAVYTLRSGAKAWAWDDRLRPRAAVLDPDLTMGLPPALTAATGADALVHAIEAATNNRPDPVAEAWALEAVRLTVAHLPDAVVRPGDPVARQAMLRAAMLAGLAIDACGTAVAHALGHALGAVGHVHHGRAVALSLRVALAGNAAAAPAAHARIARAMGLVDADDAVLTAALPGAFDAFLRRIGLGIDLRPDGLGPADADRLAAATLAPENRPMVEANCRPLLPADIVRLAEKLLRAA